MNIIHKYLFSIKFIFLLILLIIYLDPTDFNNRSPIYIIVHTVFIISICIYIIYKVFPFNNNYKKLDYLDNLYIIFICMILLRKIKFIEFIKSFPLLLNNIYNNTHYKIDNIL